MYTKIQPLAPVHEWESPLEGANRELVCNGRRIGAVGLGTMREAIIYAHKRCKRSALGLESCECFPKSELAAQTPSGYSEDDDDGGDGLPSFAKDIPFWVRFPGKATSRRKVVNYSQRNGTVDLQVEAEEVSPPLAV